MKLIENVIEVMGDVRGALHVNDIAVMLCERFPNLSIHGDKLPSKISSVLSVDVRKGRGKSMFAKVKNNSGGFKNGIYRLKKKPMVKPPVQEQPSVSKQYTGKAGEFSVMSELLFNGFNASVMTVDDGIDVVASKEGSYFHIQVKTANPSPAGGYGFSIKKGRFEAKDSVHTFYIFVIRDKDKERYFNDYLVLSSNELGKYKDAGVIKDAASLTVRIQKDSRGRYILNAKQDVTISINNFGQLK